MRLRYVRSALRSAAEPPGRRGRDLTGVSSRPAAAATAGRHLRARSRQCLYQRPIYVGKRPASSSCPADASDQEVAEGRKGGPTHEKWPWDGWVGGCVGFWDWVRRG